ncbi:translation initiation factor IF-2-like [Fukomys damarensis]|uniref:translation initiation factor IF-2-like n=1 Tax=Fukomys damarensis TaxID=885580 RepID=UPI001454F3AE|nr:translation initiation factor IF-2-like [Fukomys damarensis]
MGPRASWVSGDRSAGEGPARPPEEEPPPCGWRGGLRGTGTRNRKKTVHPRPAIEQEQRGQRAQEQRLKDLRTQGTPGPDSETPGPPPAPYPARSGPERSRSPSSVPDSYLGAEMQLTAVRPDARPPSSLELAEVSGHRRRQEQRLPVPGGGGEGAAPRPAPGSFPSPNCGTSSPGRGRGRPGWAQTSISSSSTVLG